MARNLTEAQFFALSENMAGKSRGGKGKDFPTLAALALGPEAVVIPEVVRKAKKAATARGTAVKQNSEPLEADILKAVLKVLHVNPKVAWAARMNTGAGMIGDKGGSERFMRFSFKGCSDIIGQLSKPAGKVPAGAFLAIEVKRPSGKVTEEQQAFLDRVNANGGLAFVARSVADVWERL